MMKGGGFLSKKDIAWFLSLTAVSILLTYRNGPRVAEAFAPIDAKKVIVSGGSIFTDEVHLTASGYRYLIL